MTNGLNNNEFPSKSLGPLQREQAENKKKMASFALQKFQSLQQQEAEKEKKPLAPKRMRGVAASSLAERFESPEVKAARRKREEEETRRFMEQERKRQVTSVAVGLCRSWACICAYLQLFRHP